MSQNFRPLSNGLYVKLPFLTLNGQVLQDLYSEAELKEVHMQATGVERNLQVVHND